MPEYRQNPVTGQWVVIAPERGKRPSEFTAPGTRPPSPEYVRECPFCPGHERRTPPEVFAVRDDYATTDEQGWKVRAFANKFPALLPEAEGVPTPESAAYGTFKPPVRSPESPLRNGLPGVGMHEVVVESPLHNRDFGRLDAAQAAHVVHALRHRYRMIRQARDVRAISIFKNHGPAAGATAAHPHWQIIAGSVVPPTLAAMIDRQEAWAKEHGRALFDALLAEELESGRRVVATNDEFVLLVPWAAQQPYETWIVPREQAAAFGDLPDGHVELFVAALQDALQRTARRLGDPDYNVAVHSAPRSRRAEQHHRWFVQIIPRQTVPAGFELTTGVFVNSVWPEDAAAELREAAASRP